MPEPIPLTTPILCTRCNRPVAHRRHDGVVLLDYKGLRGVLAPWGTLSCGRSASTFDPDGRRETRPCGGFADLAPAQTQEAA